MKMGYRCRPLSDVLLRSRNRQAGSSHSEKQFHEHFFEAWKWIFNGPLHGHRQSDIF